VPLSAGVACCRGRARSRHRAVLAPGMALVGLPGEAPVRSSLGWMAGRVRRDRRGDDAAAELSRSSTWLAIMMLTAAQPRRSSPRSRRARGRRAAAVTIVRLAVAGAARRRCMWPLLRTRPLAATAAPHAIAAGADPTFGGLRRSRGCGASTSRLVGKIFVDRVVVLTIATDPQARRTGSVRRARRGGLALPPWRCLGLSEAGTHSFWLTGTFLGLSYGSGLIIEEAGARRDDLPGGRGPARTSHVSIGIAHSQLEGPHSCSFRRDRREPPTSCS
jgi:hypothetical protein